MSDVCGHCRNAVIPMADGRCPSCLQRFVEAGPAGPREARQSLAEEQRLHDRLRKRGGGRDMFVGAVLLLAGGVATFLSYAMPDPTGGGGGGGKLVTVWYGTIVAGLVAFLRGLSRRF